MCRSASFNFEESIMIMLYEFSSSLFSPCSCCHTGRGYGVSLFTLAVLQLQGENLTCRSRVKLNCGPHARSVRLKIHTTTAPFTWSKKHKAVHQRGSAKHIKLSLHPRSDFFRSGIRIRWSRIGHHCSWQGCETLRPCTVSSWCKGCAVLKHKVQCS